MATEGEKEPPCPPRAAATATESEVAHHGGARGKGNADTPSSGAACRSTLMDNTTTEVVTQAELWDRQDKFRAWMGSDDWINSEWKYEDDYEFTDDCLTKRKWWTDMELVLKAVAPLYSVLRYADQQKNGTISGFLPKMLSAIDEIRAKLSHKKDLLNRLMEVMNTRLQYLVNDTLMVAAAALDPAALYRSKFAKKSSVRHAVTLALKKLASISSKASAANDQFSFFCARRGIFGGEEA